MKYFKTTTDGTRTTSATENIQFLRMMLHGESLREIDIIASQFGSTTNGYLNLIKEGLLNYFPTINALNKHKRAMRRAMRNLNISCSRYFMHE